MPRRSNRVWLQSSVISLHSKLQGELSRARQHVAHQSCIQLLTSHITQPWRLSCQWTNSVGCSWLWLGRGSLTLIWWTRDGQSVSPAHIFALHSPRNNTGIHWQNREESGKLLRPHNREHTQQNNILTGIGQKAENTFSGGQKSFYCQNFKTLKNWLCFDISIFSFHASALIYWYHLFHFSLL